MAQGASPVTCKIVALESFFCPIPEFEPLSGVFEVHVFEQTPRDSLDILHQRIHDATVIIITTIPLGSVTLSPKVTPNLRAIMIMASGTDCVDLEACRKRNIRVLNSVNANTASVAEHGMALYFAARRMIVELHQRTVRNQWLERGTLLETMKDERNRAPLSLKDEKIGVIGHGAVGQRIASLCTALGMAVRIADRKQPGHPTQRNSERTPFEDILKQSTVIFLCVPRNADTFNLISYNELEVMSSQTVLINLSRGGVVDEEALLLALQRRSIAGAAMDVFAVEPGGSTTSSLLRTLQHDDDENPLPLVVTPHLAWFSEATIKNLQRMVKENVEGWFAGTLPAQNIVI